MKPSLRNPKIFIASTLEGIKFTEALATLFEREEYDITPWSLYFENGFDSTLNQLLHIEQYDFGIIILTPDDETKTRGRNYDTPRDNIIFELGLLLGILGKERVFPLIPRKSNLKIPSDLLGTNPYTFSYSKDKLTFDEYLKSMKEASYRIKDKINLLGARNQIIFHDKILLSDEGDKLRFKIAFTGPSSILNLKLTAYLININKERDDKDSHRWVPLKLTTQIAPEIKYSWSFSHKFIFESIIIREGREEKVLEKSPILIKLDNNKNVMSIDDFNELSKFKIRLDVNGYLSSTMQPIFANKVYELSDIAIGSFKTIFELDQNGNIDEKTIDWQKFNEINYVH